MPGFIGLPEIILLGLVALILFGPKRLPEMGRGLGKGMREFKDSISGDHGLDEAKLDLPGELTATPMAPERVATAAADRRNAA
ncbi:MAG: sec-independent protein translocase protein TatA [Gaiellaceae bacterium]|jgi:sec-independent protein translocase protein TatA|nr:sec-independent protein translocase protein TatA [Gaiellaceae bacterium]